MTPTTKIKYLKAKIERTLKKWDKPMISIRGKKTKKGYMVILTPKLKYPKVKRRINHKPGDAHNYCEHLICRDCDGGYWTVTSRIVCETGWGDIIPCRECSKA